MLKHLLLLSFLFLFIYGKVEAQTPIEFIENQGQWDGPFSYKGSTKSGDIYLRKNGFTIFLSDIANAAKIDAVHHGEKLVSETLNYHAYKVNFLNSNSSVTTSQEKSQKHYYNYYLGADPSKWKHAIHPSLAVNYSKLYDGIDMHVYSENNNIKYDLLVSPNSDISKINIQYEGVERVSVVKNKLVVKTSLGEMIESEPYSYQFIDGEKVEIPCEYILNKGIVSFKVGKKYNPKYQLVIDPILVFCSFVGSVGDSWGYTATYDSSGNFYAGGVVLNAPYPVTTGAIQSTFQGGVNGVGIVACDACFTKFNPAGTAVIYATYLGGTNNEQPHSMIVDNDDNLVVAGRTFSSNFPTAGSAIFDASYNGGGDIFVCKFNALGTNLIASSFIGGTGEDGVNVHVEETLISGLKRNYADDARSEVIVDANNNIYVTGSSKSADFPKMPAASSTFGGQQDAVIFEMNPNLGLIWSRFWGGSSNDAGYVLSINKTNPLELFVAGGTESSVNMPAGSLHTTYQGGTADGFLLKFNTATKALTAGTYIGTNAYDQVYGVQTDDSNNVYITGQTLGAYPVTAGVYSNPNSSQFISKLNNNLSSILASTVFGRGTTASTDISINAFLVDKCQNVYVSGWGGLLGGFNVAGSTTNNLPITPGAIQTTTDGQDFYVIVLNKNFLSLQYGTFFGLNGGGGEHVDGGTSRFDENGIIYQAICGGCGGTAIPTTPGVIYPNNLSLNCNLTALKIKFDFQNPDAEAIASGDTVGCAPFVVQFQNSSTSATDFVWNFGDGSPTTNTLNPSHTYTTPGVYTVSLIANNPNGCTTSSDTDYMKIVVKVDTIHASFTVTKVDSCNPFTATFVNTSTSNLPNNSATIYTWNFGDGTSFTGKTPPLHTYPAIGIYTITLTMTDTNACNSPSVFTSTVNYSVSNMSTAFNAPDSICLPANVFFLDQSINATSWNWNFGDGGNSTVSSPNHVYTVPGVYTVYLVSANPATCNKKDTAQQQISIFSSPVADFTWTPNPPTPNTPTEFKNFSTGATSYLWNFGDGTSSTDKNVVHNFYADGLYDVCLTAINEVGCRDTVCKKVRGIVVPLVDVPSGFSPNGDGVNDVVYVKGYGIEKMTFRIFNRWGEKVFESTNMNNGWDGRYKGVMQEMEVYQYTLNVTFFDKSNTTKKGSITLLK